MQLKRITVFAGHYGSGKTNLALNTAFYLREQGKTVSVADIDIVNPYFRTKDSEEKLAQAGIRLLSSPFANSNVDLPSIPADVYSVFEHPEEYAVIDLGGDDRGAYALGRYAEYMKASQDADMLLVISKYRPRTQTARAVWEIVREIEDACHVRFTGIVNNSNLGAATQPEHILQSLAYAQEVEKMTGLPVVMTSFLREFMDALADQVPHPFPIDLYTKEDWKI